MRRLEQSLAGLALLALICGDAHAASVRSESPTKSCSAESHSSGKGAAAFAAEAPPESVQGPRVFILQAEQAPWEPFVPAPQYQVGEVKHLREQGQGSSVVCEAGIWRGNTKTLPARLLSDYERAETVYIVKGRVLIEKEGGEKFELHAGDAMSFDKGSKAYWTILSDDYEEFFVYN